MARARAAITRGREILVRRAKAGELDPALAPIRANFDAAEADLVADEHGHAVEGAADGVPLIHRHDRAATIVRPGRPGGDQRRQVVDEKLRDDADEHPYFFLEPIDRVEISSRRYCLLGHPGTIL